MLHARVEQCYALVNQVWSWFNFILVRTVFFNLVLAYSIPLTNGCIGF